MRPWIKTRVAEARQADIEKSIFMGFAGRDDLTLAWATSTEAQARRNRRRHLVASVRLQPLRTMPIDKPPCFYSNQLFMEWIHLNTISKESTSICMDCNDYFEEVMIYQGKCDKEKYEVIFFVDGRVLDRAAPGV